jgi:hypothetical protein
MLGVSQYSQDYVDATRVRVRDGLLVADKQIKLKPETSVLGYAAGDRIALDADGFERLAEAFLADIERKYVEVSAPA